LKNRAVQACYLKQKRDKCINGKFNPLKSTTGAQMVAGGVAAGVVAGLGMCAGATATAIGSVREIVNEALDSIDGRINELHAKVATPELYLRQKLALNMTANQLDVVIKCLTERKIIENGLVHAGRIPLDMDDTFGLPLRLQGQSEVVKGALRNLDACMHSEQVREAAVEFTENLRKDFGDIASKRVMCAFKDSLLKPIVGTLAAPATKEITEFASKAYDSVTGGSRRIYNKITTGNEQGIREEKVYNRVRGHDKQREAEINKATARIHDLQNEHANTSGGIHLPYDDSGGRGDNTGSKSKYPAFEIKPDNSRNQYSVLDASNDALNQLNQGPWSGYLRQEIGAISNMLQASGGFSFSTLPKSFDDDLLSKCRNKVDEFHQGKIVEKAVINQETNALYNAESLAQEGRDLQNQMQNNPQGASTLKTAAKYLGKALASYDLLAEQYPTVAAALLPGISVVAKTVVGAIAGGVGGAGAGFVAGAGSEVVSFVANMAIGEHVGAAMNVVTDKIATALQKLDSTLTSQEAKVLAVSVVMTASTYKSFKSELAHAGNISKSVKFKNDLGHDLDGGKLKFEVTKTDTTFKPETKVEVKIEGDLGTKVKAGNTKNKIVQKEIGTVHVDVKNGKIVKVHDVQEHHIIHQKLKNEELFKLAGMDVEDAYNKMLLPNVKGSEYINTNRSIHQGRHDGPIARDLRAQMQDVVDIGKAQEWTQQQYANELKSIIAGEYQLLKSGDRALNKNAREWSKK